MAAFASGGLMITNHKLGRNYHFTLVPGMWVNVLYLTSFEWFKVTEVTTGLGVWPWVWAVARPGVMGRGVRVCHAVQVHLFLNLSRLWCIWFFCAASRRGEVELRRASLFLRRPRCSIHPQRRNLPGLFRGGSKEYSHDLSFLGI